MNLKSVLRRGIGRQAFILSGGFPAFGIMVITPSLCEGIILLFRAHTWYALYKNEPSLLQKRGKMLKCNRSNLATFLFSFFALLLLIFHTKAANRDRGVLGRLTLARTCYFAILERTWGGGWLPPPRRFAPVGARLSERKPADSLGCCESNGTRFYPFRAYLDLPRSSQTKKDCNLWLFCFVLFFVNNFWTKHAKGMILAPSCFSRRAASKY